MSELIKWRMSVLASVGTSAPSREHVVGPGYSKFCALVGAGLVYAQPTRFQGQSLATRQDKTRTTGWRKCPAQCSAS